MAELQPDGTAGEQKYAAIAAAAAETLVGLDFDGTLSPIVADPTRAGTRAVQRLIVKQDDDTVLGVPGIDLQARPGVLQRVLERLDRVLGEARSGAAAVGGDEGRAARLVPEELPQIAGGSDVEHMQSQRCALARSRCLRRQKGRRRDRQDDGSRRPARGKWSCMASHRDRRFLLFLPLPRRLRLMDDLAVEERPAPGDLCRGVTRYV